MLKPTYTHFKDAVEKLKPDYTEGDLLELAEEGKISAYCELKQKVTAIVSLEDLLAHIKANSKNWETISFPNVTRNGKPVTNLKYESDNLTITIVDGSYKDGCFLLEGDVIEGLFPVQIVCDGYFRIHKPFRADLILLMSDGENPLCFPLDEKEIDAVEMYMLKSDIENML